MGISSFFRGGNSRQKPENSRSHSRAPNSDLEDDDYDKQWAKRYLLDPLTAPEPSQETGLGTSHVNPYRVAMQAQGQQQQHTSARNGKQKARRQLPGSTSPPSSSSRSPGPGPGVGAGGLHRYPTPPGSASPTSLSFDPEQLSTSFPWPAHAPSSTSLSGTPPRSPSSSTAQSHSRSSSPPKNLPRLSQNPFREPDSSIVSRSSRPGHLRTHSDHPRGPSDTTTFVRRSNSVRQRFPGDMSHRPLDMIKRDARAADRPIRQRKGICETDMIDSLDTVGGGPYHHGGPYDATLISRNLSKKYSPVAAVQRSNLEALRATPRENIVDSLTKHVPLQGTSTIPPGARDMSGRVMHYKEGADLMREPDAPGGAYKRWDHGVQYHPDDLKGKGEPSFTIERELKKGKGHRHHQSDPTEFEMHPVSRHSKQAMSRQRSISQTGEASSSDARRVNDSAPRRRNTTGKTLSEGLKKRFASSRRKNDAITEVAH